PPLHALLPPSVLPLGRHQGRVRMTLKRQWWGEERSVESVKVPLHESDIPREFGFGREQGER
ncbi:MAG: hypothetical protein NTX04_06460, partial [Verrucomicrobia bacterium]|nr:hypothetical protein [Verrucomicrobiota bacterium]